MKKYWKLIVTAAIIVITIGTFYIQKSFATSNLPSFTVETIEGDKSQLENISIDGEYFTQDRSHYFTLTNEGTNYDNEEYSRLWSFFRSTNNKEVKEITENHRSFMRGKTGGPMLLEESDKYVVYADIDDEDLFYKTGTEELPLEISVLNKEKNQEENWKISIPVEVGLKMISVVDTSIKDDNIHIVTSKQVGGNGGHPFDSKYEKYVINIPSQEQTEMTSLFDSEEMVPGVESTTSIHILGESSYLFHVIIPEEGNKKKFLYENGELKEVTFPEGLKGADNYTFRQDGDTFYFLKKVNEESSKLIGYEPLNEEVTFETKVSMAASLEVNVELTIGEEKIYLLETQSGLQKESTVIVIDKTTGESLYEGQVQLVSMENVEMDAWMSIMGLDLKE